MVIEVEVSQMDVAGVFESASLKTPLRGFRDAPPKLCLSYFFFSNLFLFLPFEYRLFFFQEKWWRIRTELDSACQLKLLSLGVRKLSRLRGVEDTMRYRRRN